MRKLPLATLAVLVVSLLAPATGLASLPKPDDVLIEVPATIGGVELKQNIKKADKIWGKTGECDFSDSFKSCIYQGKNALAGQATIEAAVHGQVSGFAIEAGLSKESRFVFKGRLLKFETKQGIGLGDKGKRVLEAYPDAIKTANNTGYIIEGKGKSYMTIQTLDAKRITAISVIDGKHQG
jgi:hypothetical protein